ICDGRDAFGEHGSVRDDEGVGFKLFLILLDVVPEADAADFFFAFDQDFYVDGKLAIHFLNGFESFQMNVDLAFIIGGAAAEEVAVANGGFEGWRSPEVERFRGLNVVVAIKEDRRFAGSFEGFGIDKRVKIGGNDFNFLETGGAEMVGDPASSALNVPLVLTLGANAGDAQKFAQLRQMFVAMTFYKFS